ncbi:MAG: RagB/SusD family nutrient uptake outer membrane protein, partial [Bacteroidota bacterium]|nr:RagB/SusD family nutrient uptake outer membrane protein [Bacteroidota bacterium]
GQALLMKCYLNRGAWANRAAPTFSDADMQQVITLGNTIINSGKYAYATDYFSNFSATNASSTENILVYVNHSGVPANNSGPQTRWMMTEHYNQETDYNPNAGWNGFSTISDFYNSFSTSTQTTTGVTNFPNVGATNNPDTMIDTRLGGRFYPGVTNVSGQRVGLQIGQQYDQNGVALNDRKGHPLSFNPTIAATMQETGSNLEVTGIRVVKYAPDFTNGTKYYEGPAGNDIVLLRYSDVVLMVAEAYLRAAAPNTTAALTLVNGLRSARGATPLPTIKLVGTGSVQATLYDPNALLTERGRELYWESVRRTDLIRFGVETQLYQYKTADDPKYLLMPIPNQALAANPNLTQNPGY